MTKRLSAFEALNISISNSEEEVDTILEEIRKASNEGKTSITHSIKKEGSVNVLRTLGYTVANQVFAGVATDNKYLIDWSVRKE